jgi:mono/diheme cytochrome c family protein
MSSPPENRASSRLRNRIGLGFLAAAFAFLVGTITFALWFEERSLADSDDARHVALGRTIYDRSCASCHGSRLEGQPQWQEKLPSGRLPAPPHDATGHTWHHPDAILFGMTKLGLVPGKYAPPKYESDMPAFAGALSDDEIWAALAYIKSTWPREIVKMQRDLTLQQARR